MRIKLETIADIKKRYKLLTQLEIAERCGASPTRLKQLQDAGEIPAPSVYIGNGRRAYYTEQQCEEICEYLNADAEKKTYTRRQVARLCGVTHPALQSAIDRNEIPAPSIKLGKRRYYTRKEADSIKAYFEQREPPECSSYHYHKERREEGYLSRKDVCRAANISPPTLEWHISQKRIPAPSRKYKTLPGKYYSEKEAKKIVRFFEKRNALKEELG